MTDNRAASASQDLEQVLFEVKRVIVGQDHMVERLLVALLARGHCLLEGLPGLAKTLAVSTLSRVIGGSFVRLQFTPDLLPADLIGTRIWRSTRESFDIEWGPVFANLVLADEINRAPAKVQSALLEVMAERQVSIGGVTRPLPQPFLVLATQNPVESEGVYALPEAQRDRFLMKVVVGYPSPAEELEIVRRMGTRPPEPRQVIPVERLLELQATADDVYVDGAVAQYAVDLVMATREPSLRRLPELDGLIEFGVSPRASLGLVAAGRALALLRGREYATAQDVFDVAADVLRHRLVLSYEALARGLSADDLLNRILAVVPAAPLGTRQGGASSAGSGAGTSSGQVATTAQADRARTPAGNVDGVAAAAAGHEPTSAQPGAGGDTPPPPPPPPGTTGATSSSWSSGPEGSGWGR